MKKLKLKYVGSRPKVSGKGVTFDQSKPDRYTFLNAAVELLEALNFEIKEDKKIYLYDVKKKDYSSAKLTELLGKHCGDLDAIFNAREETTNALIKKYTSKVKRNENINKDERKAWLGNIKVMRDYYLQYVTNESAYECALNALADLIHASHIETVTFPIGRNHGLVLSHLVDILRDHKPPYDATLSMKDNDGVAVGELDMNRSAPLDI
ncbi:MAG: hypothetical protein DRQ78_05105 [Epsilonproteobacteria bacterium]|nr:MAG: hypothetical protein DRQ78_05105 [Campylobacterota bacterium]